MKLLLPNTDSYLAFFIVFKSRRIFEISMDEKERKCNAQWRSNYSSINVSILFPYLSFLEKDLHLNVAEKQILCKGKKFQLNIVQFIFNNLVKMYVTKNIISLSPRACSLLDMLRILWYQKSNMPLGWSWNIIFYFLSFVFKF